MSDFQQTKKGPMNLVPRTLLAGFAYGDFEHRPSYDNAEFRASFPEDSGRRDSRVSIRVSGKNLTELQKMALAEGIPTQTLIGNIIHNYVQGLLHEAADQRAALLASQPPDADVVFDQSRKK